jgi:hypothetical protein
MSKITKSFSCSQEVLYLVCTAGWNLCSNFLSQFTAFRAIYTPTYVADNIQAVKDAQALTPSLQSIGDRSLVRTACVNALTIVQADWQRLKTYIGNAFDADQVQAQVKIAGGSFYAKVSAKNWSAAHGLIDAANTFITNNLDALTANGNMPAGFQTTFQTDGNAFIAASAEYASITVAARQFTGEKNAANEAIYQALVNMLTDGKKVFAGNKVAKKQFVFTQLVKIYKGGSASLIGTVTNANGVGIEDAVITSSNALYSATTNSKGKYRITRIAEGTYNFTISCPGYTPVDVTITFSAGVKSKADATLANAMKKVA